MNVKYKTEYKKYLASSILDSANNKIASTSFMTAFAIFLGISPFAIGIYTVLDVITNIIQIFAAPLFSKIGQSKKVVLTNYAIYRIASVCFAFIPFISSDISIRTALFFVFASIYAITGELGYITFVNWRMTLLKKEDRLKFTATKNFFKNFVVVLFSFLMGVLLQTLTNGGKELLGFLILFAIVFVIAFVDIAIRIKTYKPPIKSQPISVKETISIPAKDKNFRKILVVAAINRFAIGIGTIYLNVFLLQQLNLNYIYYSVLNLLIPLTEAFSSKIWAKISKNRKWHINLIATAVMLITSFFALLLIPSTVLLYILPLIFILIGMGQSAYSMFDSVAIYEHSKENYQTSYVTFERFVEGLVTAILPFVTLIFKDNALFIKITFALAIMFYALLLAFVITITKNAKKQKDIVLQQQKTNTTASDQNLETSETKPENLGTQNSQTEDAKSQNQNLESTEAVQQTKTEE